jgi:hypothetical protein
MKSKIYLVAVGFILLASVIFLVKQNRKLLKERNTIELNQVNLLLEKDSEILKLSKKAMALKIENLKKDSAFNVACKERDINKKRVTDLIQASTSYSDSFKTKLIPWPILLQGESKIIKISNYSDGWNSIHNELIGDSLKNILDIRDSINVINHYGWYGWKILPRFTRERWDRTEIINQNKKIKYKINFSAKRE